MMGRESVLLIDKHVLLCADEWFETLDPIVRQDFEYIKTNFCGRVYMKISTFTYAPDPPVMIYLCGNINRIREKVRFVDGQMVRVIRELSHDYNEGDNVIGLGEVPINIHGLGVHFRNAFNTEGLFEMIESSHRFLPLTDSNKGSKALRTGTYLSKVIETDKGIESHLLRCATNIDGPTDNFRDIDNKIISTVNTIAKQFFDDPAELNHVLAQIYENVSDRQKARISSHSDKSKDMPADGSIMAFCTFLRYRVDDSIKQSGLSHTDFFDYCYGKTSVFTRLRFRLKSGVERTDLPNEFEVILYPNSVFLMSLSTNRLYTHEICPSSLPASKIPIRLGYVIRCSKTIAVFKDGKQHIVNDMGECVEMARPDTESITKLKKDYFDENTTIDKIDYGEVLLSLNEGDYLRPII
jgi:hypothetical protein